MYGSEVNLLKRISQADALFLRNLLIHYRIKKIGLKWSNSTAKHPDIWVTLGPTPVITVTQEWARQTTPERQKRLVHEVLHILGHEHGRIGKYNYSTYPSEDTYSKAVYLKLLHGSRKDNPDA